MRNDDDGDDANDDDDDEETDAGIFFGEGNAMIRWKKCGRLLATATPEHWQSLVRTRSLPLTTRCRTGLAAACVLRAASSR